MIDELKKRLKLNFDVANDGLSVNVKLKKEGPEKPSFTIGVFGEDNVIGGTIVVVLTCDKCDGHFAPKFNNDNNVMVFLNALLSNTPTKTLKESLNIILTNDDLTSTDALFGGIDLINGYSLGWMYVPAPLKSSYLVDGVVGENKYLQYVADNVSAIIPFDATFVKTEIPGQRHPSKLYEHISNTVCPVDTKTIPYVDETRAMISDYVAKYIYDIILDNVGKRASAILTRNVTDIPVTNDGHLQEKWLKTITSSAKKDVLQTFIIELIGEECWNRIIKR